MSFNLSAAGYWKKKKDKRGKYRQCRWGSSQCIAKEVLCWVCMTTEQRQVPTDYKCLERKSHLLQCNIILRNMSHFLHLNRDHHPYRCPVECTVIMCGGSTALRCRTESCSYCWWQVESCSGWESLSSKSWRFLWQCLHLPEENNNQLQHGITLQMDALERGDIDWGDNR